MESVNNNLGTVKPATQPKRENLKCKGFTSGLVTTGLGGSITYATANSLFSGSNAYIIMLSSGTIFSAIAGIFIGCTVAKIWPCQKRDTPNAA